MIVGPIFLIDFDQFFGLGFDQFLIGFLIKLVNKKRIHQSQWVEREGRQVLIEMVKKERKKNHFRYGVQIYIHDVRLLEGFRFTQLIKMLSSLE